MTLGDVIWVVSGIAALLTAILVIWNFSNKLKTSIETVTRRTVKEELALNDTAVDYRIKCSSEATQKILASEIQNLDRKIDLFLQNQKEVNSLELDSIKLLKESLIEAYKQDMRTIYYRLRDTGEISDHDKSYVDKLFPKYIALGGNSDIEAKYTEMCRVYETITQENFEKARAKAKRKKEREEAKRRAEEKASNNEADKEE